jgi:ANTAR domain-containing protein
VSDDMSATDTALDQGDPYAVEIAQLRTALESRDIIGQAKGVIRVLTHTDSQSAFDLLARISTDTNRKLRDVAELIADCAAAGVPLPDDVATSWRRRVHPSTAPVS